MRMVFLKLKKNYHFPKNCVIKCCSDIANFLWAAKFNNNDIVVIIFVDDRVSPVSPQYRFVFIAVAIRVLY